jgi:signal transduction histidine kinase
VLFIICIVSSYFLIRNVLQNELDEILLRTKSRIEKYAASYNEIPAINSFSDQQVKFEKTTERVKDSGFSSTTLFIAEQNKSHISRKLIFFIPLKNDLYKVAITEPLEGTRHLTILIVKIAVVTIFFTLILLLLINRQLLSKLWAPFYSSLDVISHFKVKNSGTLGLPASDIEEFELMNNHFEMAAANAARDYQNLKLFSENASHEIQTPLAIIRSKLDLLIQEEGLTEKQSDLLSGAYSAVSKLSRIQQSLLLLTKIDNRQFSGNSEIKLKQEVNSKVEAFKELWQNKGITSVADLEDATIYGDPELMEILLNNLFGNATRHNINNGLIKVKLAAGILEISNTASEQALDTDQLFKRFYKGSLHGENNGLGLSIVKEICDVLSIMITYEYHDNMHCFILKW